MQRADEVREYLGWGNGELAPVDQALHGETGATHGPSHVGSTGVGARREQRQRQRSGYLTKTGRRLPAVASNLSMIKDHHQGIG